MKVIEPSKPGVEAGSVGIGKCFIHRDVVHMRMSGLSTHIQTNEIAAVILSTGAFTAVPKAVYVAPVTMVAVEGDSA